MTTTRNYLKPAQRIRLYEWLLLHREELIDLTDRGIAERASEDTEIDFKVTHSNINSLRVLVKETGKPGIGEKSSRNQAGVSQHWTRAVMMGLLQTMKELDLKPSGELVAMYEKTKGGNAPKWMVEA